MTKPTVSGTLDKASYVPGETPTLSVAYADADNHTDTLTITGTDQAGNAATVTVQVKVSDPVTVTVTDSSGRVWTERADSGTVKTFRPTTPL